MIRLCLALAVLLGALASYAAEDPAPAVDEPVLDELVIVATKYASSPRDIAADVLVLTREDLAQTLSGSLADAFRFVPGISHENAGSRFGTDGLTIRGIGGNRIAVEFDGVPMSDQFDVGNFSNATRNFADSGLIGHVEVLRGPASAIYGSSALGGVVVMSTPDPRDMGDGERFSGQAGGIHRSADDSSHLQASVAVNGESMSALFSATQRDGRERESAAAGGNADAQDYVNESLLAKLVGQNAFGHDWAVSAVRQTRDVQTDIQSVLGNGRFRSTTRLEGDDRHETELISGAYRFAGPAGTFDDGQIRVFYAESDTRQDTLDERAASSRPALIERQFNYSQRLHGAELNLFREAELAGWTHQFGFGVEWTEKHSKELRDGLSTSLVDGSTTTTVLGESFPLRDFPITETREIGAWLSDQITLGPVSLMLALRFDENRLTPTGDAIYAEDNPATELVTLKDSDLSPKIGAVWHVHDDVDVYLQYARGFRAPPFEDANIGLDIPLFNIRAIPNPDLRSETSDGWEAGVRWLAGDTQLHLGLFHTDYDDFIETKVRIGVDPQSGRLLFQSINIGDARIRGAEARLAHELSGALDGLTLHAAAYWAQGENHDSDEPLNSVGPAEAVLGTTWRSADDRTSVHALLTLSKAWTRRDESGGELFKPGGYGVLDVFFAQSLGRGLTLRAGVENVTDQTYWHWSEVRGLAPDDPVLPSLAEAGRNYSIGLRWDW